MPFVTLRPKRQFVFPSACTLECLVFVHFERSIALWQADKSNEAGWQFDRAAENHVDERRRRGKAVR